MKKRELFQPSKITLRAARMLSGYTSKDAAAQIGISTSTLRQYEYHSGSIPLSKAMALVELYDVHIDDLVFS